MKKLSPFKLKQEVVALIEADLDLLTRSTQRDFNNLGGDVLVFFEQFFTKTYKFGE